MVRVPPVSSSLLRGEGAGTQADSDRPFTIATVAGRVPNDSTGPAACHAFELEPVMRPIFYYDPCVFVFTVRGLGVFSTGVARCYASIRGPVGQPVLPCTPAQARAVTYDPTASSRLLGATAFGFRCQSLTTLES